MFKRIRPILFSIGLFGLMAAPIAVPAAVYADEITSHLACGSNFSSGSDGSGCDSSTASTDGIDLDSIMKLVINIFSIIVGFIAVIMIIVGGVKYITSGGDSGNISGAKNTIVYAVIGLIVVALAQILVHFVLQKLAGASGDSSGA